MGSKATYFSLSSEELVEITDENLDTLPKELRNLLAKWKIGAAIFKSDFENRSYYYYVKGASEVFRYQGVAYVIYPGFLGASGEYFEHLMLAKRFEDELVELGAQEVFCTGMMD